MMLDTRYLILDFEILPFWFFQAASRIQYPGTSIEN